MKNPCWKFGNYNTCNVTTDRGLHQREPSFASGCMLEQLFFFFSVFLALADLQRLVRRFMIYPD